MTLQHPTAVKPIGSNFEPASVAFLRDDALPGPGLPWGRVSYAQSGSQALAAVAQAYQAQGRDIVLAPRFLCASMIAGFSPEHWQLVPYAITDVLEIDPHDLEAKVQFPERTVALIIAYFGREPSPAFVAAVNALRERGVRVVDDETHRVLGALPLVGDVGIASLRKLLPVADGAYLRGEIEATELVDNPHAGWLAMDAKARGNLAAARGVFQEAEAQLEAQLYPPTAMSDRTHTTLARLDFEALRDQRRRNATLLIDALHRIRRVEVLNECELPSHVVVRVNNPPEVQARLAKLGVFCPIHWPQPERLAEERWPMDLLSLPVDHRYDEGDMVRLAQAVETVVG